ncbi:MAG: hypothetical protein ABR885_14085 [Mycobacterium sp.]|jgi:transposase
MTETTSREQRNAAIYSLRSTGLTLRAIAEQLGVGMLVMRRGCRRPAPFDPDLI